jgi:MSHA biogenesis protein MshQ
VIQTLSPDPAFVSGDLGRKTISYTVPNSYPDVRLRITYPAGAPTKIGCSNDNFAIRPNTFTFANPAVSDDTWLTAGTTRTLNNSTLPGGTVHKAGRPFSVSATAVNTASTTTTNYTGAPTPTLTDCGASSACPSTLGTVTLGSSFVAGVLTATTASYSEVGSFAMQLVDSTFANVDAGDGSTTTERNITSGTPINVGRFVPDYFAVALNTPSFGTACGSFTYIGQAFNYATAPVITVTARNFADGTTVNYAGALWQITSASLTGKSYTAATGTLDTSGITGTDPVIVDSGGGIGTLTFSSGTGGLLFTRSTPVAFDADISLAINVIDADGVAYASNPASFGAATAGNGIAFSGGKPMRFGQLALGNALGSEVLNLPIPIQTQYWNGTSFVTNTLDSCTTITASNIALSNYQGALTSGNLPSGNISTGGTFNAGIGNLKLTKPSSAVNGSVDLCVDLGGDATCVATPAGMSYLQGVWSGTTYTLDPRARAAFGFSKGSYSGGGLDPFVYQRENY